MSRTYSRLTCHVCGKEISSAGAAMVNHFRKHVREGLMIQKLDSCGMYIFERPKHYMFIKK